MKKMMLAVGVALAGSAALADDYKITVTNMMDAGRMVAPLIVLDAGLAEATLFDGNKMSDLFKTVATKGDPRPMNGKMPEAIAGPVLGKSGPPGVLIDGGETASSDMFIPSTTIRFYAKDESCADCMISGVWDLAFGDGELMLHSYSTGQEDGSGEIKLANENVVKVTIKAN